MCVVGNTMKKRAIRKAALHRVQNGKIFRMILKINRRILVTSVMS